MCMSIIDQRRNKEKKEKEEELVRVRNIITT